MLIIPLMQTDTSNSYDIRGFAVFNNDALKPLAVYIRHINKYLNLNREDSMTLKMIMKNKLSRNLPILYLLYLI